MTLFEIGLNNFRMTSRSLPYLWSLGFGNVRAETVIGSMNFLGSSGLVAAVLVANSPQLVLSFLYFAYNGIFTCMLITEEWCGYALKRKPLRVSSPKGVQRGTHYLQLPYRYALPIQIMSGVLHWLVSQSMFLARVDVQDTFGREVPQESISTIGYSPIANILFIVLGFVAVLFGIGTGLRKYKAIVPLAGSCSAVISAACHPPEGPIDAKVDAVKWEMVGRDQTEGGLPDLNHFGFTSSNTMSSGCME